MTIDYLPAVKAFCETRREQIVAIENETLMQECVALARMEELQMVISLCNGLAIQQEMFSNAMPEAKLSPAEYLASKDNPEET